MKKNKDVLSANEYYMKKKNSDKPKNQNNKLKGAVIALSITTGVLALGTIGFGTAYGVFQGRANDYGTRLEAVYQKNFYDLVESVNNSEIKLSKLINSSTPSYQRKLLIEVSQNSTTAETSIASLPLSQSDINDNVRMINQISGYTSTLAEKLAKGGTMTSEELKTLQDIYDNILTMKQELNKFARKMQANGYSILNNSLDLNSEDSDFSTQLSHIHDVNIEYPTMIYDGPFSDSVVNAKIKGLTGSKISKQEAQEVVSSHFKNVVSIDFEGDTKGRFDTYNFRIKNSDEEMIYVQVSQIGGHILTASGSGKAGKETLLEEDASAIALDFAKANNIENPQIVWQDTIENDTYFNIAPMQGNVVLYPDLVKIKVDLTSGTVVGYDATTYFTNHTARSLESATASKDAARGKIPTSLTIVAERTVLAPLDYNREVLCYEFECVNSEDTFYFYINASTGEEENILKVIKTDDGSKLM